MDRATEPRRPWLRYLIRILAFLILGAIGIGGWMAYRGLIHSVQAEINLHDTTFTARLVEHFVEQRGRWPRSWAELEGLPIPAGARWGRSDWPASSAELQRHVRIDFTADPVEIARQDPMSFTAIEPIGPYYEYWQHGHVPSLQATIRRSIKERKGDR